MAFFISLGQMIFTPNVIRIDFDNVIDEIRPVHNVGRMPEYELNSETNKVFTEANMTACRTHDITETDIHNIFPDFSADVNDEKSYRFEESDKVLAAIVEYGMSPFYLRMMYRCMLANGEMEAAQKYKTLLETTLFYSDYEVTEQEVQAVRRFMTGHDQLTNDRGYSEKYLLERLSQESYDTAEAQQIAVHFAILARSQSLFDKALARYQELVQADPAATKTLPKYFNQTTFDWYYERNTGNKSY